MPSEMACVLPATAYQADAKLLAMWLMLDGPDERLYIAEKTESCVFVGLQGFYDDGGVPSKDMVEVALKDARSLALANISTQEELTQSLAHVDVSEKVLAKNAALLSGVPRPRKPEKPADEAEAHRDQQRLLELDWSLAIASGQTQPPPKPSSKKLKLKAGKGKTAIPPVSSSTSSSAAPPGSSEAFQQRSKPKERAAAAAANSTRNGSGFAGPGPRQEDPSSDSASHVDSAAPIPTTATPAGEKASLKAAPSLAHASSASTQAAADVAGQEIPPLHVNSSAVHTAEASSFATSPPPLEGSHHASSPIPLPASCTAGSSKGPPAAASSSSSNESIHSNNRSKVKTQV